jgi:hypothetical protein
MTAFSVSEISRFKAKLSTDFVVQVPSFFSAETVQKILAADISQLEKESVLIAETTGKYFGSESIVMDPKAHLLVHMILNQSEIIEFMQKVTNDPSLKSFRGRIYKMDPAKKHELGWHNDNVGNRRIGISINLNEDFGGSAFQIREKGQASVRTEIRNGTLGSMLVFSIDSKLEHCLTPLEGSGIKMAVAGWFLANEEFSIEKIYDGLKI